MTPREFEQALAEVHDGFNDATLAAARVKMSELDRLIAQAKDAGLTDAQVGSIVYAERFKGSMRLVEAESTLARDFTSERSLMP